MHSSINITDDSGVYPLIRLQHLSICKPDIKIGQFAQVLICVLHSNFLTTALCNGVNYKKLHKYKIDTLGDEDFEHAAIKGLFTGLCVGASTFVLGKPRLAFLLTLISSSIVHFHGFDSVLRKKIQEKKSQQIPEEKKQAADEDLINIKVQNEEKQDNIPTGTDLINTQIESIKISNSYMEPLAGDCVTS